MKTSKKKLRELIEEGTIDCYGEDEQFSGMATMLEDNVDCPFQAKVVGEEVTVTGFEWPKYGFDLKAVCERKGKKHLVDVGSLELIKPYPDGYEWIEAFLFWRDGAE
jgi:hypothetical protein